MNKQYTNNSELSNEEFGFRETSFLVEIAANEKRINWGLHNESPLLSQFDYNNTSTKPPWILIRDDEDLLLKDKAIIDECYAAFYKYFPKK